MDHLQNLPAALAPLALGLPAVLLLLGLWLLWPAIGRWRERRALERTLHNLGPEIRRDIVLEDGLEGLVFIDYAVSTPEGIAVVDVMAPSGAIFGAENADHWSQVVGHRTVRFDNPLTGNRERVQAVRYNLPKVPVRGFVLFPADSEFPKGKPPGVVRPAELERAILPTAVPATRKREWDAFVALADTSAVTYRRELALSRGPTPWARPLLGALALLAAAAAALFAALR